MTFNKFNKKVIPFRSKKPRNPIKYKGYKTFKQEALDGYRTNPLIQ